MANDAVIQIAALEHHEYCPRQCALIHTDGVWTDNAHTLRGQWGHRRADSGEFKAERGRVVVRSVALWSEHLGLTGRADAIEIWPDGHVVPVEYKIGTRHGRAAEIQLCAQALCLEEMTGTEVAGGAIWYSRHRRRQDIRITAELRAATLATISDISRELSSWVLPPAPNDERCGECQLLGHCLPDIVASEDRLAGYLNKEVFACE